MAEHIVSNGETNSGIILNSYDSMTVLDGGMVNDILVPPGGTLFISSGGIANDVKTQLSGFVVVSSGGLLTNAYFSQGIGRRLISVENGGVVSSAQVHSGADLYVSGYAYDIILKGWIGGDRYSDLFLEDGGYAERIVLYDYSDLKISAGCTATDIQVYDSGDLWVYNGGTANNAIINFGGLVGIEPGDGEANVSNFVVNMGGRLYVSSGGTAIDVLENGGFVWIADEASVTFVPNTIQDLVLNRSMTVHSGTTACDITINRDGNMLVYSGGVVSDLRISSGGYLSIEYGKLTGKITVEDGGEIYAGQGTVIDFDISCLAQGMSPRLNDLSRIQGDSPAFSLSVSEQQGNGTYTLAKGVAEFDSPIPVKSLSHATDLILAIGETVNLNGVEYTLNLAETTLSVTVTGGRDIPIVPVSADITTFANQAVTLTAEFSDDAVLREYSLDNETWHVYTEPVKCESNGIVYFLGKDLNGSISEMASFEISNIDKVSPEKPTAAADITEPTDGAVTVTAVFSEDSFVKEFSLDGENWQDYKEAVELTKNGIVYFRGTDEAGNKSEIASYTVSNIRETIYNAVLVDESRIVESGWIYSNTTIENNGSLIISSGGTAEETAVHSGGSLFVSGGGIATGIVENGGYVEVEGDAEAVFAPNTFSGLILSNEDRATVHSGTTAIGIIISSGGSLYVSSGGTASAIDWTPCVGTLKIDEGAEVSYASQYTGVYYGDNGRLISHTQEMKGIAFPQGGSIYVMSGKLENIVGERTSFFISSGGTANSTLIFGDKNVFHVYNGGVANDTLIIASGDNKNFYVSSGGTANRTAVISPDSKTSRNNYLYICNGGIANDTMLLGNYNSMFISSGGTANNTLVNGELIVFSGGIASNIDVRGRVTISSGGLAANVKENGGWVDDTRNGGTATFVSNSFSGVIGMATVHSGTTALHATILPKGSMLIFSDGIANDISVYSSSVLHVSSGGSLTNCTILSGGSVRIDKGNLTGRTVIQSGGSIEFKGRAVLDFDLTQIAPGAGARINTLSRINGTPVYTITVNANQTEGIYKLAEDASEFKETITVKNSLGDELGILMVGETVLISDTEYTLILSDSTLSLKIGEADISAHYTSDGLVLSKANIDVESGEVFHDTIVFSDGSMSIREGGIASNTKVHLGGNLFVESGVANNTTIFNGGNMFVSCGGTVDGAIVNPGGSLCVASGGTALEIKENGGFIEIQDGAVVTFASNTTRGIYVSGSTFALHSGTTMTDTTTITKNGSMLVLGGAMADCIVIGTEGYGGTLSNGGEINNVFITRGDIFLESGGTANSVLAMGSNSVLYVSSGGTANNITICPRCSVFISSGGMANDITLTYDAKMYVSSGGVANDITAMGASGKGPELRICSGGTATNIVCNSDGKLSIEDGAVIHGITFNPGMSMSVAGKTTMTGIIENGGAVKVQDGAEVSFAPNAFSGVILGESGNYRCKSATVHSGTTAVSTTMLDGSMFVYEGGKAIETVISKGGLIISSGGTSIDTTVYSGGSLSISSGGTAINAIVNGGGNFFVKSGGTAENLVLSDNKGKIDIQRGAVIHGITLNSGISIGIASNSFITGIVENGGYVRVEGSAISDLTFVSNTFSGQVFSQGSATVHSGTTAFDTTITSGARIEVYESGRAVETTLNGGGLTIYSGGTADSTQVNSGGSLSIDSGGTANSTTINFGGRVRLTGHNIITMNDTIVNSGGFFEIRNNSVTAKNIVENGGYVEVADWVNITFASNTFSNLVLSNTSATVHSGTTAVNTAIESIARLEVFSGGVAESISINANGKLVVSSGGTANNIAASDGGILGFAVASDTYIQGTYDGSAFEMKDAHISGYAVHSGGSLTVHKGGIAEDTTIDSFGRLNISSGGTATNIIASKGAYLGLTVASDTLIQGLYDGNEFEIKDALLSDYTVLSYISLTVCSGGTVNDTQIEALGGLYVKNGGMLTGMMTFEDGADVWMDETAVLDFDLTQTIAGAEALVNDLSIIQGIPLYTLTVSATLSEGLYLLAEGASTFDQTVSVVNIAGDELGTLTVGGTTAIGKYTYALALTGSSLTVDVVKALPPDKPTISVDVSLPTNGNVIVSAEFSEDCVKREYALDGETWQTYIDEIVFSENGSVSFRGIDTAGKVSEIAEYEVLNIDKEPPEKPTASADITTATNKDVTVTAVFSEDSVLKEYSLDGEAWLTYTKAIILENNGIVYFRGTDEVGNTSEIASYEVVNIDRLAPEKPTVSADITTVTNKDVTVTAIFSEDSVKMEYSFDGENWLDYSGGIAFPENGTVMFRGTDAAGNVSEVTSYTVDYIDRLAPEKPIVTADVTTATKGNVKVSAVFSEDSEINKYSLDGENWRDYTEAVEFTENGTVYFQGTDEAGNPSEIAEYTVANIDKDPPKKPIPSANITTPTNHTVTVSALFDADSVKNEYTINGLIWLTYEAGVPMLENGIVYFRSTDAADNVSEIASYTVDNIDKVAPEKPFVFASNTKLTNQDITVTAVFSEDSTVKEYSTDGQTWLPYTEPLVVSANGIMLFRAKDEAGNSSEVVTFEVSNIDKEVPVITLSGDNTTPLHTSTLSASTEDGLDLFYSTDKENWMKYEGQLEITVNAVYYFTATDAAGNIGTAEYEFRNILPNSVSIPQTQTWEKTDEVEQYTVEYSTDNFEHVIRLTVDSNSLASFNVPAGGIQWRVKPEGSDEWTVGEPVTAAETDNEPKLIKSDEDGNADVFFAKAVDIWESGYLAQHVGSINDWNGTNEYATVSGKNKLADIIEGSTDANILLMTDDDNGDGLFVDDIYTTLPGTVSEQQSRIAQIDEIRAGAGADIVDMTSQRFEYIGNGLTIRGGDGNDTIWANKGDNFLFGDAGNDRIVGASGNDVIAGGIGNDRMHGGGGDDVFTFCENWGVDNVEQLAGGSVTLWFASGSMENWDKTTLTYSDGNNSVKVSGVIEDQIMLKFGDDGSDQFATLSGMGAFFDATTKRIFEESGKGILASL